MAGQLQKAIDTALKDAVREATQATLRRAKVVSSGTRTLAQLASMDHPFAQRHPVPLLEPAIINMQSGAFKRDWKKRTSGLVGFVENDNPVVPFLTEGTRFMHIRPIDKALQVYADMALIEAAKRNLSKI